MTTRPMPAVRFKFDLDEPTFDGFAVGTTWNGFDNVCVTPCVLAKIRQHFTATDPEFEPENFDIAQGADGLVSLCDGFATVIVVDEEPTRDLSNDRRCDCGAALIPAGQPDCPKCGAWCAF